MAKSRLRAVTLPVALLFGLTLPPPGSASAQELAQADRGPRFLRQISAAEAPVEVDLNATPVLRRRVSLTRGRATLGELLATIRRQTGLKFIYSADVVPVHRVVGLQADSITVAAALTELLVDVGVDVVFYSSREAGLVQRPDASVQGGTLSGRVTDAKTGQGLVGAEVLLEGSRWRTLTGEDAQYRLAEVEPGSYTLVARRIGYGRTSRPVRVESGQETVMDVALEPVPTELEEVVVTGTVVPTEVKALPTPITVLTAQDIERHHVTRLDEIFRFAVPGGVSWDLGANNNTNSIAVRGTNTVSTGSSSVKIYVDGIQVADDIFSSIDVSTIERIELIRGPQASTIYGSGSSAGVLQVFTKKGAPGTSRPQIVARASAGSIESQYRSGAAVQQDYSLSVQGGTGDVSYYLNGSYSRTGAWVPEFRRIEPSLNGGVQLINGPLTLGLTARYSLRTYGSYLNPLLQIYPFFTQFSFGENKYGSQGYGVQAAYAATSWWQHHFTIGLDRFSFEFYNRQPRESDSLFSVTESVRERRSLTYNTSVTARVTPSVSAVLTAGVDHYTTAGNGFSVSGTNTNIGALPPAEGHSVFPPTRSTGRTTGYFAQGQLGFSDALFLTAGVRAEDNINLGYDYGTTVVPRVGIAYTYRPGSVSLKMRASYGEAIGSLRFFESNFDGPFTLFNPDLRPEKQVGGDFGFDLYLGNRVTVSATYYRQTGIDLIDQILDLSTFKGQLQNVGRVRNQGLELEAGLRLGSLDLNANYALTDSKVRELTPTYTGTLQVGDRLPAVPRHTVGTRVTYAVSPRTSLNAALTYIGAWTNTDWLGLYGLFFGGEPPRGSGSERDYWIDYPAVTKLNLGAQHSLNQVVSAFLAVENVTDNDRFEFTNITVSPGRRTTLGVQVKY